MNEFFVDITKLISNKYTFYAHLNENKKELLIAHINLVEKYFCILYKNKNIEELKDIFIENYFCNISYEGKKLFNKLLFSVFTFHDIGKINPLFQNNQMKNEINISIRKIKSFGSKHSLISSLLYMDYFLDKLEKIEDKEEQKQLRTFIIVNAFIISRHHSHLNSLNDFENSIKEKIEDDQLQDLLDFFNTSKVYLKNINNFNKKLGRQIYNTIKKLKNLNNEKAVFLYTYCRFVYSLLVACDFYATSEFVDGIEINDFGEINEIQEFYSIYKSTDIYNSIKKYEWDYYNKFNEKERIKNVEDINILRNELFLDSQKEILNSINDNIFYLEAPTGGGKSNIAMNLSFKLIENNKNLKKIYYVYPFNTLVEQNKKTIEKIYKDYDEILRKIVVVNSTYPINEKDKTNDINEDGKHDYYKKALLNRQFLNYPFILTTHVSLFDSMFNKTKESCFSFHQLANSVIVLDEIQSYKNDIWTEIIMFLKGISTILNIKVIIMSATLPNLDLLTVEKNHTTRLIKNTDKYFNNKLFKDRVKIDYSLIDSDIDALFNHIKKKSFERKKILIEFIKKESAYNFFYKLADDNQIVSKVLLITGDDNSIDRENILCEIDSSESKEKGVILVATQVIEAGVDIDMDIGYKDISKLDSEEQFMGRINRSCKNSGIVYFFNYDNCSNIYKNDCRVQKQLSLINKEMQSILKYKRFSDYYKPVLNTIIQNINNGDITTNINIFFNEVKNLNFEIVSNKMKLIDDDLWSISVFLSRNIKDKDGKEISGSDVWKQYKYLLNNNKMDYAEKQIKLNEIRCKLNYFIYQVKKSNVPYNDKIGELFYIEDGENYFVNGKVDKEKLITGVGDFL